MDRDIGSGEWTLDVPFRQSADLPLVGLGRRDQLRDHERIQRRVR